MKTEKIKTLAFFAATMLLASCGDNEPQKEDVPELITKVTLTFTPTNGNPVIAHATDPDGEGVQDLTVDTSIALAANTTYNLSITLVNGLAEPTSPDYNVTSEVEEQGHEHMFFFGWTGNLFSNPAGEGNISSRQGSVNYTSGANSVDVNNLPLGLTTIWTTSESAKGGTFRILLKHQPGLKSATSTANDGETDVDVTFEMKIQ
jgi:hypothetical protein